MYDKISIEHAYQKVRDNVAYFESKLCKAQCESGSEDDFVSAIRGLNCYQAYLAQLDQVR